MCKVYKAFLTTKVQIYVEKIKKKLKCLDNDIFCFIIWVLNKNKYHISQVT